MESIWQAVYHLTADRIGHGLRLLDKEELIDRFHTWYTVCNYRYYRCFCDTVRHSFCRCRTALDRTGVCRAGYIL
ncbi:hypothetical protein C5N99_03980 [Treponema medium]|uniref:Adenosine deaminase n=1 Tax=Treponema medium TaxID=58231 RepID=A0ABX7LV98_TREMD|nr:hypothetical protein C5N99_03980 [Treponema medium]QSH96921.1 hypothetical protein DWB79_03930 [Treponema medium]